MVGLRDFDELARYDFATYCRGEATRWGGDVVTPYQANVPVVVSKVGIHPGDFIFADSAGAVVIPPSQVEVAVEEALRVNQGRRRCHANDRRGITRRRTLGPTVGQLDLGLTNANTPAPEVEL